MPSYTLHARDLRAEARALERAINDLAACTEKMSRNDQRSEEVRARLRERTSLLIRARQLITEAFPVEG